MDRINGEMHPLITKDVAEALISKQIHTVLDFIKAEPQQVVKAARLNFRVRKVAQYWIAVTLFCRKCWP